MTLLPKCKFLVFVEFFCSLTQRLQFNPVLKPATKKPKREPYKEPKLKFTDDITQTCAESTESSPRQVTSTAATVDQTPKPAQLLFRDFPSQNAAEDVEMTEVEPSETFAKTLYKVFVATRSTLVNLAAKLLTLASNLFYSVANVLSKVVFKLLKALNWQRILSFALALPLLQDLYATYLSSSQTLKSNSLQCEQDYYQNRCQPETRLDALQEYCS